MMYLKYRNSNARHYHEKETKKKMFNLKKADKFIKHEKGLSNPMMEGANNTRVNGQNISDTIFDTLSKLK